MKSGDDAGMKETRLGPEVLECDFVAPSILAEQESSRSCELGGDGSEFSSQVGCRERLGADEQPVRRLIEQRFDVGDDLEL